MTTDPPVIGLVVPDAIPREVDDDRRGHVIAFRQSATVRPSERQAFAPVHVPLPDNFVAELTRAATKFFGEAANPHVYRRPDGRFEIGASMDLVGAAAFLAAVDLATAEEKAEEKAEETLSHARRVHAVLTGRRQSVATIAAAAGLDESDTRAALRELKRAGMAAQVCEEWWRT